MLDRESLFRLEPLKNVGARFAQSEAELLGHKRIRHDRLGSTEGPRAVGHRPKAGGSAAA
jgi:hypothetical protein